MSYDFTIRKDRNYSESISRYKISEFLSKLNNVVMTNSNVFEYSDSTHQLRAEIYLEHVDKDGEFLSFTLKNEDKLLIINAILVCIPYANLYQDDRDQGYFTLIKQIALFTSWIVYDEQTGEVQD